MQFRIFHTYKSYDINSEQHPQKIRVQQKCTLMVDFVELANSKTQKADQQNVVDESRRHLLQDEEQKHGIQIEEDLQPKEPETVRVFGPRSLDEFVVGYADEDVEGSPHDGEGPGGRVELRLVQFQVPLEVRRFQTDVEIINLTIFESFGAFKHLNVLFIINKNHIETQSNQLQTSYQLSILSPRFNNNITHSKTRQQLNCIVSERIKYKIFQWLFRSSKHFWENSYILPFLKSKKNIKGNFIQIINYIFSSNINIIKLIQIIGSIYKFQQHFFNRPFYSKFLINNI